MKEKLVNSALQSHMQLYTTLHECSAVQNLAQYCFLLFGVICVQKQVMGVLWLEETRDKKNIDILT
jgi:heme/copper-type cytochrome/quinol oxidase subunit 4